MKGVVERVSEDAEQPVTKSFFGKADRGEGDGIAEPSDDDYGGDVDPENGGENDTERKLAGHDLGANEEANSPTAGEGCLTGTPDALVQEVPSKPAHCGARLQAARVFEVAVGAKDGSSNVPAGFVQHE